MNRVEEVLSREVDDLLERLEVAVPEGGVIAVAAAPGLRARVDDAEGELARLRERLVEDYGCWRRALENLENLWAACAWRSGPAEQPAEQTGTLAA